jgi:hypothetical protein
LKKVIFNGITLFIFIIIAFSVYSCKSDSSNPVNNSYDANTINGTITFVDTNMVTDTTVGKYYVALFGTWFGPPSQTARIYPIKSGGKYTASYKILAPSDGNWSVAVAWVILPPNYKSWFLGVYDTPGRDTSRANIMEQHLKANITGGVGVGNINFNSYIDTAKNIYIY